MLRISLRLSPSRGAASRMALTPFFRSSLPRRCSLDVLNPLLLLCTKPLATETIASTTILSLTHGVCDPSPSVFILVADGARDAVQQRVGAVGGVLRAIAARPSRALQRDEGEGGGEERAGHVRFSPSGYPSYGSDSRQGNAGSALHSALRRKWRIFVIEEGLWTVCDSFSFHLAFHLAICFEFPSVRLPPHSITTPTLLSSSLDARLGAHCSFLRMSLSLL
ncbi:hypothetical protein DFH06DRAFT_140418 [Mycena polygramma]|nr:hypothetical protein DFH06DRAFT_140418 [Mycena polygramma]